MGIMVYSLLWVMQDFDHQMASLATCDSMSQRSDFRFHVSGPLIRTLGVKGLEFGL